MPDTLEFSELLEKYMDQERMHHFESESGVRNLEKIAKAIGYRQGLNEMLADNPFLQEAIIIALTTFEDRMGEWTEHLQGHIQG